MSADEQLEFTSLAFPKDRRALYVGEVAERLGVTEEHVSNLIEEGKLQAFDAGGGGRRFWRIPVEAYDDFLKRRHSFNVLGVKIGQ